jgi:ribosomal protein S6--L-glutamate ligase
MHVIILSARSGWQTNGLRRALTERGHTSCLRSYEGLVASLRGDNTASVLSCDTAAVFDADAVLARIIPDGSLEQIIYRMNALHWIETRGVRVMNSPAAIERCIDKFYTTALLQEAGLPIPDTVVCEGAADAMSAVRMMGDVIIKPIFGSSGRGMVRVSDPDVALRVVRSLAQVRSVFYVQRAMDHDGRDFRVFIVGGRVLGAVERRAPDREWRTNVSRGGVARPFELPPLWERLALSAAAVVGTDYAGVDLLASRDGTVFVLEVNSVPGWRALQRATGIDVAGAIVDHLVCRVEGTRRSPDDAGAAGNHRTVASVEATGIPARPAIRSPAGEGRP